MTERDHTYLFEYFHDGSWWALELHAPTKEDAEARLKKLPHARYEGELVARVPAGLGWFARLWVWLMNWRNA